MDTAMLSQYSVKCRTPHILGGTDFWTYVDWDLFAHLSEYYTPLEACNPSFNTLYKEYCIKETGENNAQQQSIQYILSQY
jgi:hypothetical protein